MKWLSYKHHGRIGFGVLRGTDSVVDLSGQGYADLKAALAAQDLPKLAQRAADLSATLRLDEISVLPPIIAPEKILCVGINYGKRNEEYQDGSALPAYPSVFVRFPGSLVGHGQPLLRPPESVQLDYEGEIALIIGKPGRRIALAHAWDHVAGLTCVNEGTVRDWTRHGKFNVTQGKNFDASGSIGPWMVSADTFDPTVPLTLHTRVNGELRQHDHTGNLIFSFAELIHYLSTWTRLEPGDIISTGTPIGSGGRATPPRFLQAGDVVEVEVSGIGTLSNPVIDEGGQAHFA